jgi:hypothetical protein
MVGYHCRHSTTIHSSSVLRFTTLPSMFVNNKYACLSHSQVGSRHNQLVSDFILSHVMMCTMNFPPGQCDRHQLHGILNECILEQQPQCPYSTVADGITFSEKSFGVRLSGEPIAKKTMKGPWEGYSVSFMGTVEVVIPTVSPDRGFHGYIHFSWVEPLPWVEPPPEGRLLWGRLSRGLTEGCALYKEPVVTVTLHGLHGFIQGGLDIRDSSGEVSYPASQRLRHIE